MYLNPMSTLITLDRDQAKRLSSTWWIIFLIGAITLIAGFVIIGSHWTLANIAVFFGVLLIARGLFQIGSSSGYDDNTRGWNLALGVLSILVGFAVFVIPVQTLHFIATFIGVWLIITGLFDIIGSLAVRRIYPYWWLALVRGIIAVPLGSWALGRPFQTLSVVLFVLGVWAIAMGILEIVIAFEIRRLPRLFEGRMELQPGTT